MGATTVTVYQVGRNRSGGAAVSASRPRATAVAPGARASSRVDREHVAAGALAPRGDSVIAWDGVRGVWLANSLAIAEGVTRLTIRALPRRGGLDGPDRRGASLGPATLRTTRTGSRATTARPAHSGRCYLAYTLVGDPDNAVAVQRSDDGVTLVETNVTGVIPVVQQDGALTLVFWSPRNRMVAVRSTDGGVTLGRPVTIAEFDFRDARPFRSPPILAADIDGAGRITAVCRAAASTAAAARTTSSSPARRTG